eukprot:6408717-Prymnesium_polylepis.1
MAANRSLYFSAVFTTLGGIGPDTARDWLDSPRTPASSPQAAPPPPPPAAASTSSSGSKPPSP